MGRRFGSCLLSFMRRDGPILRLALPSVAASLSVPIIGFADTILVGHLDQVAMLGAVSVGAVVFDVIFWGLGFFRMGTTALVAQAFGARELERCRGILFQSAAMALLLGFVLVTLRDVIGEVGFGIAGPTDEVVHWGRQYLDVRIYSAPLVLVTFVLTGFFRGCGDAMSPLWMTIGVNLVNVVLDYALIYGKWGAPELGVAGAAWASVIAVAFGALLAAGFLLTRHRAVLSERAPLDRQVVLRIIQTNGYLFGRTACLLFTQFFGLSLVARMGDVPLAAHAVAWQIWSVVSYFVDGFAHAAETLVGNAIGALNRSEAIAYGRRCMVWGVGLGVVFGVGYLIGMGHLVRLFTDHEPVLAAVAEIAILLAWMQPICGMVYILDGVLIGADDARFLFIAMAIGAFAVYFPAVLLFTQTNVWGLWGVWLAYNGLMLSRFGFLAVRFRGGGWARVT